MLQDLAMMGDFCSGIGIIITLAYGWYQLYQHNSDRQLELNNKLAEYFRSPEVLKGVQVVCRKLSKNPTLKELNQLDVDDKDAINAVMYGMKGHGILVEDNMKRLPMVRKYYDTFPNEFTRKLRIISKVMSTDGESIHKENYWIVWLLDKLEAASK